MGIDETKRQGIGVDTTPIVYIFGANYTPMAIYRFHIEIEDYEGISREIDIKSSQTFEDLHYAILRAFSFDVKHPASFFYSDDLWHMEDEIAFKDMQYSMVNNPMPMNKTRISDYIDDPHQRFVYVYQSDEGWAFLVELVNIDTGNGDGNAYPRMTKSVGEAPKQYPVKTIVKPKIEESTKTAAPDLLEALDDDGEEAADDLVVFESLEAGAKSSKEASIDLDLTIDDDDLPLDEEEEEDADDEDDLDEEDDDDFGGGGRGGRRGRSDYDDDDY